MTKTPHIQYDLDEENNTLRIERPAGACLCGCGLATNGTSKFRQGHDQRYRGALLFAYRNGLEVGVVDGGMLIGSDARTLAHNDGVEMVFTGGGKRAAKPVIETPVGTFPVTMTATEVESPEQDNNEFPLGRTVQVKVGRWTYTAEVIARSLILGDVCTLEYNTKARGLQTTTKPTSEVLALLAEQQ